MAKKVRTAVHINPDFATEPSLPLRITRRGTEAFPKPKKDVYDLIFAGRERDILRNLVRNKTIEELNEIVGVVTKTAKRASAPNRRSTKDIQETEQKILEMIQESPSPVRAVEIRNELGLSKQELLAPMKHLLEEKLITKKGERVNTVYSAK